MLIFVFKIQFYQLFMFKFNFQLNLRSKEEIKTLEAKQIELKEKFETVSNQKESLEKALKEKKSEFNTLKETLENKIKESQHLCENLQSELTVLSEKQVKFHFLL